MNPQDDPEARIRQLEQQSANYGAVELGTTQASSGGATPTAPLPPPVYGPPPPYGNPYTGDPYQPPQGTHFTPIRRKGSPVGLIFVLIAVIVVAVFGGIGAIVWNVVSKTDAFSSIPGGGGSFGTPGDQPTISVPTPELPILPTMPGDTPQTGTPGGQLTVAGIDKVETVACNDGKVSVSGVNNTITLTGHCLSVTVSGVNNRVTIDNTDTIGASGFDNQVIYLSGDPQIDATGSNVVERG